MSDARCAGAEHSSPSRFRCFFAHLEARVTRDYSERARALSTASPAAVHGLRRLAGAHACGSARSGTMPPWLSTRLRVRALAIGGRTCPTSTVTRRAAARPRRPAAAVPARREAGRRVPHRDRGREVRPARRHARAAAVRGAAQRAARARAARRALRLAAPSASTREGEVIALERGAGLDHARARRSARAVGRAVRTASTRPAPSSTTTCASCAASRTSSASSGSARLPPVRAPGRPAAGAQAALRASWRRTCRRAGRARST